VPARWRGHAVIALCRCGLRPLPRLSRRKQSLMSVSPRRARSSPQSVSLGIRPGGVGSTQRMSPVRSAEDDRYPHVVRIRTHEARNDRARNGSRTGHPLYALYVAKNETSDAWFELGEKSNGSSGLAVKIRLLRLEFFPSVRAGNTSKTANPPFYRWEKLPQTMCSHPRHRSRRFKIQHFGRRPQSALSSASGASSATCWQAAQSTRARDLRESRTMSPHALNDRRRFT
jgi:hypothetical protein